MRVKFEVFLFHLPLSIALYTVTYDHIKKAYFAKALKKPTVYILFGDNFSFISHSLLACKT